MYILFVTHVSTIDLMTIRQSKLGYYFDNTIYQLLFLRWHCDFKALDNLFLIILHIYFIF